MTNKTFSLRSISNALLSAGTALQQLCSHLSAPSQGHSRHSRNALGDEFVYQNKAHLAFRKFGQQQQIVFGGNQATKNITRSPDNPPPPPPHPGVAARRRQLPRAAPGRAGTAPCWPRDRSQRPPARGPGPRALLTTATKNRGQATPNPQTRSRRERGTRGASRCWPATERPAQPAPSPGRGAPPHTGVKPLRQRPCTGLGSLRSETFPARLAKLGDVLR